MRSAQTRKSALALTFMLCCCAGHDQLTGAEDVESESASRVRILTAALEATGDFRVVLRGPPGACSPWRHEAGKSAEGAEGAEGAGGGNGESDCGQEGPAPALRDGVKGSAGAAHCPSHHHGDHEDGIEDETENAGPARTEHQAERTDSDIETPALRPMPLRSDLDIPKGAVGDVDTCDPFAASEDGAGTSSFSQQLRREQAEGNASGKASAVGDEAISPASAGTRGGALDGLLEHLEDDAMRRPPQTTSKKWARRSLDQHPGAPAIRFHFLSPLAVVLDVAGMAGYVVNYLIYQLLVSLLPSSLRRSDRAMGMTVLASSMATLPMKYSFHKIAGDFFERGEDVTPTTFGGITVLSALASPLLVGMWDQVDVGKFTALMLGSTTSYMYRHFLWKTVFGRHR